MRFSAAPLLPLLIAACGAPAVESPAALESRELPTPAAAGSFAPRLTAVGEEAGLTWIEKTGAEGRHRIRFARLDGVRWSAPSTIVAGDDLFANWADLPAAVAGGDGALYAHWLAKTGEETYAYSIFLARSDDEGSHWRPLGRLNDDDTSTEHGFVSWLPEEAGVRAVWLDGREMASGGPMTLRTALVDASGAGAGQLLDERVCECCNTAAARSGDGTVLVAYRDRAAGEVRDIATVRGGAGGWSEPMVPHADGWGIPGCPVNGPGVAAAGSDAALVWFTAAGDAPTVRAALSSDGGETFAPAWTVDAEGPLGRVDAAWWGDAAWVVWMAPDGDEAEVRLARVSEEGPAEPLVVARTSAARASGFPRLLAQERRLLVAWTEVADGSPRQVRLAEVPLAASSQ